MTDRRRRIYTVRYGNKSVDVVGLDGIAELLPFGADAEFRARKASINAAISTGGGSAVVRLAALPGVELHVTRHEPEPAEYSVEVWRGRIVNARTIDADEGTAFATTKDYLSDDVAVLGPEVLPLIVAKLPSVRARLSTNGNAYIQAALGAGQGIGIRITRKD